MPTPFPVGPVNGWLMLGDEPALVDVGPRTDEAWAALVAGLAAHGVQPRDLRHIVITHAHVDHYGNAARLAEAAPDAAFYAAALSHARPMLLDEDEAWAQQATWAREALLWSGVPPEVVAQNRARLAFMRACASRVPVSRWLQAGEWLAVGGGDPWQVVALPGHSMTQIGLWQPDARQFIVADHLLPRISTNALLEPPAPGETRRPRALPRYMETLHWTADLPPQHLFPGHGDPFFDQRPLIARRLAELEARLAQVRRALRERPRTVVALVDLLFPALRDDQLFLAVSEVVGLLDVLEARGQAAFRGDAIREFYAPDWR